MSDDKILAVRLQCIPKPAVVHRCPPIGSGLTPCCGRTPFELLRTDRMTVSPKLVTCTGVAR